MSNILSGIYDFIKNINTPNVRIAIDTMIEVNDSASNEEFDRIYEKHKNEANDIDDIDIFTKTLSEYSGNIIKNSPILMRFNYILNMTKIKECDENDINWDMVNDLIFNHNINNDYNLVKSAAYHSLDELKEEQFKISCALAGMGPWRIEKCKKCGEEFFLYYDEMEWFSLKGLKLPKRCMNCRMDKKSFNYTSRIKNTNIEEDTKLENYSPMQAAFDALK